MGQSPTGFGHATAYELATTKAGLRRDLRRLRRALPAAFRLNAAEAMARHARALISPLPKGAGVALYYPAGSEADARFILPLIEGLGLQAALPAVVDRAAPLRFRAYGMGDPLENDACGIPAPTGDAPEVTPQVIIVPLLGFSADCFRLGQGGGFYDRTLPLYPSARAIGLGFSVQLVDDLPREPHDVGLHAVLTEQGLVVPGRATATSQTERPQINTGLPDEEGR